jgi:hypothetical protein
MMGMSDSSRANLPIDQSRSRAGRPMSTLVALQRLDDAQFHRLCDELSPRISTRYFPLTPHGVSSTGMSIKGQPDSFVGESIAAARVAISYSIQKRRWWTKLLDDVQKARIACPVAAELVWATSRDTERDGNPPAHWFSDAEAACAPAAVLTVLSGRRLSHLLDTEHQDLRFQYLEIPHSRLTYASLVDACRKRTERATRDLQASGRYDANAYVVRRSDGTIFELWEACGRASLARERPRLIPIVSDAGLGKTSLLCRFAESFSSGLRASKLAYDELFERGDVWALPELIKVCVGGDKGFGHYMAEHLLRYPRHEVADAVRRALGESPSPAMRAELNRLLGFFGGPPDFASLRLDAKSSDHILANAADEGLLRLEDPLRLPDNWSSLRI